MAEHDSGYKLLFSHPEMVEDLIRGFVHEDWVRDLDFTVASIEELTELTLRAGAASSLDDLADG
ncbi:MAG TPA: hypothetical protein VGM86_01215 [Thermoanaerobaculia bacterium]